MTKHRLMHAFIWLADYMKPLHSAGARNFDDGYSYNLVIRLFMAPSTKRRLLPDRLLPDVGAAAEVQIRTSLAS